MPTLLPPTLGERVAQCGTRVEVWGITPGAEVTLDVNGAPQTATVNATAHTFVVASLPVDAKLRARQKVGADVSAPSNILIAEAVPVPTAQPLVERELPRCIHAIFVYGVAPGGAVEVRQGEGTGIVAAQGLADRAGFACMAVTQPHPSFYHVTAITCGATSSPDVSVKVVASPDEIPRPTIVEPIFECQSVVAFQKLIPGAVYEIFVIDRNGAERSLGTFIACTPNMTVGVPHVFRSGDKVKAIGSMVNARWQCAVQGRMTRDVPVVPPDDRIKPVILEPVWEDDPLLHVVNQIEGGTIALLRKADAQATAEDDLGRRPASKHPELPPGTRLAPGNVIRVVQELCGVSRSSDDVTVRARPAVVPAPVVRGPVLDCAEVAIVEDVIPGAWVWVRQLPAGGSGVGTLIGKVWSPGSRVAVPLAPRAVQGTDVFARQEISGQFSLPSRRELVEFREFIPEPVVVAPVRASDSLIWCDNLLIGARVRVLLNKTVAGSVVEEQIGGGSATDTLAPIPVWGTMPPASTITAKQVLCRQSRPSREVREDAAAACDGAPVWDPSKWNDGGTHEEMNNCYNYACDLRLDNKAQPGAFSPPELSFCDVVAPKALADGLRRCPHGACPPCHHKVALVVNPGIDYHWYRQDADGMWSHKRGNAPAKNVDESGNPIASPETADRDGYTEFCGYFCVYKPHVTLRGN